MTNPCYAFALKLLPLHPALNPRIVGARNLLLRSELLQIVQALGNCGIDCVVLKGVPLAYRLFGRLDGRTIGDNDVLVRRADAQRALDTLFPLGYEPSVAFDFESLLRSNFQYSLLRSVPSGGRVCAELHWSAFSPVLYPVSEEIQWSRIEPFPLGNVTLQVFDRPLTIIHLAVHFAHHLFSQPRIIRDLAQAWNLWGGKIDHDELRSLACSTGLSDVLAYGLWSARDLGLIDDSLPELSSRRADWLRRILPAERLLEERPNRDYVRELLQLFIVDPRCLPRWARDRFFPPIEMMAAILNRPVSRSLYLRYFTRLFRPVVRMLSRDRRLPGEPASVKTPS